MTPSVAYESSDDEDDVDVSVSELVQSVFKSYAGNSKDLIKTQHFLENQFQSDAATCLICIARVRRSQPIWSCEHCYCFLHLACIQRWANDSLSQKQMHHENEEGYYTNRGEYVPKSALVLDWYCPQCRKNYPKSSIPTRYTCFCGKEDDPQSHPWTIPHSCGEVCGKSLQPNCGHKCVLLCHPGGCPPCPQMITKSCDCGESPLKTIRCSAQSLQCGKPCQRMLSCGNHKCLANCHKVCKPCPKRMDKKCMCGKSASERVCSEDLWRCTMECDGMFGCGLHACNRGCHEGACGPCNQPKTCPCGKERSSSGDCSTQVDSCGDTCLKALECGQHMCLDRCHKGPCSKCKEVIEKSCFCGQQTRLVSCEKPFRCETKCKKLRNCKLHLCNRKCCDGQCPPCDKICEKPLGCTKHKCKSMCHTGPCYPCNIKTSLKCRCRGTVIEVACGRAKKTKPPKCHLPCRIASKCHHENVHHCHGGDCPTCGKTCNLANETTNCSHPCQAKCHDSVLIRTVDKNWKPAGPWDVQPETIEFCALPHPKCEEPVMTPCLGGHDTIKLSCWDSQPRTCGRPCGRRLKCGNHGCDLICHPVTDMLATEANESECNSCAKQCELARPTGCDHPCRKPCHRPPCGQCTAIIKTQCHCGLVQQMFKCSDAFRQGSTTEQNEQRKIKLMSCGNRCIRTYPCGHRCVENCHPGPCPNPEQCKKKVKVACICKVRKVDVSCEKLRQGPFTLDCDETCQLKMDERKKAEVKLAEERMAAEEEQKRIEMEEFQKKYGTKKPKERKQRQTSVEENRNWLRISGIAAMVLIPVVGVVYYLVMGQ